VNTATNRGSTPLFFAARQGHLEVVKMLSAKGAKIDSGDSIAGSAVTAAAYGGHVEVVRFLISKGASLSISQMGGPRCRSRPGGPSGHGEVLDRGTEGGPNQGRGEETALNRAIWARKAEIVSYLLGTARTSMRRTQAVIRHSTKRWIFTAASTQAGPQRVISKPFSPGTPTSRRRIARGSPPWRSPGRSSATRARSY